MNPERFGKVALLMGGEAAEREISLMSGSQVLAALQKKGVDVHPIDVGPDIIDVLSQGQFDRAFIILHGAAGEDGTIQGVLEMLNIPYTGADVAGSAFALDKARSKWIWQALGLPTAPFILFDPTRSIEEQLKGFGFPLAVKPTREGSSVGVSKVTDWAGLPKAIEAASLYGEVIIEKWIEGEEYSVGIVGDQVLPSIRIEVEEGFYDYHNKYFVDTNRYECPGCPPEAEREIQAIALKAFQALSGRHWGRVDFMRDRSGQFYLLELNTLPGMTPASLLPKEAAQVGISFEDLVIRILEQTL
ncbi:MAG: D-alanine--D-alanine ligase [Gammaproteobacteria bacterium]|nr:D-alanine--D-alanine ligase [Gammaproteobacteria bacterium]